MTHQSNLAIGPKEKSGSHSDKLEKTVLAISGLTALGVGTFILVDPHGFYASYGITLADNASLLSELRAPAAGLSMFGLLMLVSIWRTAMTPVSITLALTVFLAFPAGRIIGLAVDGLPSDGILAALAFEIVIAALCVATFGRRLARPETQAS